MSLEVRLSKRLEEFTVDVDLSLGEELMVLFGPSGAGKTMVLRMISGLVEPDSGTVAIGERVVFDSRGGVNTPIRNRGVGYLFQDYALFPHMTVFENISYGISASSEKEVNKRVAELVEVTRLTGLEGRYPRELSGGQKQRTALARTLATSPRILLLDEPFSALDHQVREKLRGDLLRVHEIYPVTTVLVTHDLEEAFMLGTRIAVLNEGRIEQFGGREEVFYRPATRNVARFMGVKNIFTGRVGAVVGDTLTIECPHLGPIKAHPPRGEDVAEGQVVSFCIRPEDIPVIRPDKVLHGPVRENLLDCVVTGSTARGSTHVVYLSAAPAGAVPVESADEGTLLKVEVPNFVVGKMKLYPGSRIRVSLKKESVWVIPG